ncbi:MAG: hypothetical protein K2X35_19085 [Bryobacteraceae bacterium]|nr:hypothetical protein [Bryobacteraceae bacterium]
MKWKTFVSMTLLAISQMWAERLEPVGNAVELPKLIGKINVPAWQNGRSVRIDHDSGAVLLSDNSGRILAPIRPLLPGGRQQLTRTAAVGPDQSVVAVVSGSTDQGQSSSFLMFYDSAGQHLRTVRTRPYAPFHVSYAQDGTLWTVGRVYDERFEAVPGHEMVRHYSADGRLLKTALPTSLFPPSQQHPGRSSALAAGGDRIAVLLETAGEWVELDTNGQILGRYPWKKPSKSSLLSGISVTSEGEAYVAAQVDEPDISTGAMRTFIRLFRLDRAKGEFVELGGPQGHRLRGIAGTQGPSVVFWTGPNSLLHARPAR